MNKANLPIYCVSDRFLEYEEWFAKFEDDIDIELAETGADRELDFDREQEFDKRYEMHLNTCKHMNNHTIETLDSQTLSIRAKNMIIDLTLMGFSPKEIKEHTFKCIECLEKECISSELPKEIYSFLCNNWEAIKKIGV